MIREVKIDKAIYVVDDEAKVYKYLKKNPAYQLLSKEENERNKWSIDGYTRIFKTGKEKLYLRIEHPYGHLVT